MRLHDKTILITGGTTGMGLAAAVLFAAEGGRVTVTGSNPITLEAARRELGDRVRVLASDAGSSADIKTLIANFEQTGIDVLFVNAGVLSIGAIVDTAEEEFDRLFRINVKGPWLVLKYATPLLRAGASVILNASINAHLGMSGSSVYSATKAAVRSFGRTAASELAAKGVRVNVLSPGVIDTGITEKHVAAGQAAQVREAIRQRIPMQRWGRSDEAARVALFLASDDSTFMTGEEIVVDGGMTRV
jgi:NAD(P)-dependent dehydrogenase (short-subunit alcohol dehydrogenase family)